MIAKIEIPMGSLHKYEVDKRTGELVLDRLLNQPIPYNYGYIPGTICEDGDALDVFVLSDSPIHPLAKVNIEVLGVLKCTDNGQQDDKILATIVGDFKGFSDMGNAIIQNYLETYKTGFKVISVGNKEEAMLVYEESVRKWT